MFNSEVFFSALLPQTENTILGNTKQCIDIIRCCLQLLYEIKESATLFFVEKSFQHFDPHVGDTACQIRAHLIYYLYKKYQCVGSIELNSFTSILDETISNLEKINKHSNVNRYYEQTRKLGGFLVAIGVNIKIKEDFIILTLSYILSKYRKNNQTQKTVIFVDPNTLMNTYSCSRKKAKKLIHHFQKSLAHYSCLYIYSIAKQIDSYQDKLMVLNRLQCSDDDGRSVLPCYFSMEVMINYMKKNSWPIFLVISYQNSVFHGVAKMLLEVDSHTHCYHISEKEDFNLDIPSYIIKAVATDPSDESHDLKKYFHRLHKHNIVDLILAYMAAHPQYTGSKLHKHSVMPLKLLDEKNLRNTDIMLKKTIDQLREELLMQQSRAHNIGCSSINRNLFFIEHIYCDNISSLVDVKPEKSPMIQNEILENID